MSNFLRTWLASPVPTLLAVGVVTLLSGTAWNVSAPSTVVLTGVALSAFLGGVRGGLLASGLAMAWFGWFFSMPDLPFRYHGEDVGRMLILSVAVPALAILVGTLQERSMRLAHDRIADLEAGSKKLERSEQRFRRMFESSPMPMWVHEPISLRFLDVNSAAVATYGYSKEEFLNLRVPDLRVRGEAVGIIEEARFRGEGTRFRSPWRHETKGGRALDVELCAEEVEIDERPAVLVVALDVTEAKRTARAASWLVALVESSEDAIFTESLEGIITSWNPGAVHLYGWRPEEILGRSVQTIIPRGRESEMDTILSRVRRGERVERFETERVDKEGRRVHVSLTVAPVREGAAVIGASVVARRVADVDPLLRERPLLATIPDRRARKATDRAP